MRELVQWQLPDHSNNLVFPWFTHPFLEVLNTWDLKDKIVLEYGGGRSTAWWRQKSDFVVTIESNIEYYLSISEECYQETLPNGILNYRPVAEGDQELKNAYVKAYPTTGRMGKELIRLEYDIVAVDGILRYECMQEGIELLSGKGGILIVDNWQQDGFICPACADLVNPYKGHVYLQPDHVDHHGNPWQTAYWEIPKR